jgi:MFS transporter, PAT family, beta-lactamase induction signal transducer AmpG
MAQAKPAKRNPWAWIPSLYYAEGIPYVVVMTVSVIMYKRMGISNTDIALYTSWLYLPWVIKPLWSPVVDLLKTKRFWIVIMQLFIGAGLAGVAFTIPVPNFFQYTLAFFWLLAFSSATHDIAADGFYMLGLSKHDQAWFVGIRSTFYRFAMITGQGLLIILAGHLEITSGLPPVEMNVYSNPNNQTELFISQDIEFENDIDGMGFNIYPQELSIATQQIPKSTADSISAAVREHNTVNGFYSLEKLEYKPGDQTKVGNIGIVYFKLSQPPQEDEEVVLNFGRESGDNSINLIEGGRYVFNRDNWDSPAMAVIQLDPKLTYQTSAYFQGRAGDIPFAWMVTFLIMAGLFILFSIYHKFILPYPASDKAAKTAEGESIFGEFFKTFALFFKKEKIGLILAFILLYRLAEAQLVKMASPFLLDNQAVGGLGLTTGQVGFVYGTIGILFLTLGGIVGGVLAARNGLKHWLWWMIIAINLPDLVYVYLAFSQTTNFVIINAMVAIEQFGYGFGFTAYMLYLIYVSEGNHKTAHYAIATGFMALGMMIPGMFSGAIQEWLGYQNFFIWVCLTTIPGFIIIKFIPLDPEFGKKTEEKT